MTFEQDLVALYGWWLIPAMYAVSFALLFVAELLFSLDKDYKFSFKMVFKLAVFHATICIAWFSFVLFMKAKYGEQPEPPAIERIYFDEE